MIRSTENIIDPYELGLEVTKISGDEAVCVCPFHSDHRPSSSINLYTGVFFCFGCGATFKAEELAAKLGGYVNRIQRTMKFRGVDEREWEVLLRAELAISDPYLIQRQVDNTAVKLHGIMSNSYGIIFPLRMRTGSKPVGAIVRRKLGFPKYMVFGEKPPLWPMTDLQMVPEGRRIFIVEGIFGALRARSAGVISFATIGAMIKYSAEKHLQSLQDHVYGLFDNDFAGYAAGGRLLHFCPLARVVIPGREADEMDKEEWKYYEHGDIYTTRRLKELARLSQDSKKFYSYLPHTTKTS